MPRADARGFAVHPVAVATAARTVQGMDVHPESITDWATAETWELAHDLTDFRSRLILGSPEHDWSHEEAEAAQLDVYKRFDPVRGWEFAIYRACPDGALRRVGVIGRVPDGSVLRELARNSLRNGHDWWAEAERVRHAALAEAERKVDEAAAEVAEQVAALRARGVLA